jgi:hypothetical protein
VKRLRAWFYWYFGALGRQRVDGAWARIVKLEQQNSVLRSDIEKLISEVAELTSALHLSSVELDLKVSQPQVDALNHVVSALTSEVNELRENLRPAEDQPAPHVVRKAKTFREFAAAAAVRSKS